MFSDTEEISFAPDLADQFHVPFTVGSGPLHGFSESDDKLRSMPLATPGAPRGTAPPAVSLAPAHHVLSTGESGLAARKHIVTPQPAMAVGQGTIAGQVAADGPLQPVPRAHDEESSSNEI